MLRLSEVTGRAPAYDRVLKEEEVRTQTPFEDTAGRWHPHAQEPGLRGTSLPSPGSETPAPPRETEAGAVSAATPPLSGAQQPQPTKHRDSRGHVTGKMTEEKLTAVQPRDRKLGAGGLAGLPSPF